MGILRRILGLLVMIIGILGLVISLAGLVGIWMVIPTVGGYVNSTILTLNTSINTSQKAMEITGQALGATVDSVDALSAMLGTTAATVEDTKPMFEQINLIMGETLPSTLESATDSLNTAQEAAVVLDSAIKSLDTFRFLLSSTPLFGALVEQPEQAYNPDVPLADSLGELASTLADLPAMFTEMSASIDTADDNLDLVQTNLITMSDSVSLISNSLSKYETMVGQSRSSMDNLTAILTNIENNLPSILNGVAIAFSAFFVWLLVAQVVIFTQGWELYQGTAGRMEGGPAEPAPPEPSLEA
jgi:methyl-accepting chemotaxis protein